MNRAMKGLICLTLLFLAIGLDLLLKAHDVHFAMESMTGSVADTDNIPRSILGMVCCIKWLVFALGVVSFWRIEIMKTSQMFRLTFIFLAILFILLQFVFV